MILFKKLSFCEKAERKRINTPGVYNKRQKKALLTLLDLFVAGKFQECASFMNKKNFPYTVREEYPELEHVCPEMYRMLQDMTHYNYYTSDQLLEEARATIQKKK